MGSQSGSILDTQIIWPIARVGDDALEDFHFPIVDRGGHGGDIEDEPLDMAVVLLDEIALADAAAPGPHGGKGAGKVPAKGAAKAKAKAKGKVGAPRATYHRDNVYHRVTGVLLGHIRIFAGDHQLTARCQCCGYRKNAKYRPWGGRNPERYAQGRPMGALLAWLHLPCPGQPWAHAALWSLLHLPHDTREGYRSFFRDLGCLDLQFGAERPLWAHETASGSDEPQPLC